MPHPSITESVESPSYGRTVAPSRYLSPLTSFDPDDDDDFDGKDTLSSLFEPPPPDEPTFLIPGSPEKIELLAARYAAGVQLWHDDDLSHVAGTVMGRMMR